MNKTHQRKHSGGAWTGRFARAWQAVFDTAARAALLDEESVARLRRIQLVGMLGVVGHPLYYWIWSHVFPQRYENLGLRLLCTALFIPLLFASRLSRHGWLSPYALFAITVGLPFAFVFFYLENAGALAWAESVLIAVVILYHFSTAFATISLLSGTAAAVAVFLLGGNSMASIPWDAVLLQLPILAFVIAVLFVIKIDRQVLVEQKQRGMAAALATVAHELRTPLTSLAMTVDGIRARLPRVLPATDPQLPVLLEAAERMRADLAHVHNSIELLVANSKDPLAATKALFDPGTAIHEAIARFPFEPGHARLVRIEGCEPMQVLGNAQLFELVITNLTKNALEAIRRAGKGEIHVRCAITGDSIEVVFRDTATGVPPHVLKQMFQPFFSYPAHRGTGIGLAFCRNVLRSWGASISCDSVEHEYTEFRIRFPRPELRAELLVGLHH
ncbi:two-component sensor histidine kinase [Cupriavidus sp. USMAHM13]|uniref:histidine kinase n=1 Tax=Cupriavidus malaysiensis TaxID=367825 RepID=A0A1D9IDH1_9BURK|nr:MULTISPECIES: HAMP domain-containing sensor histidine kinase [Cupriavidus]AOZ02515.1 two-component sensor histidine kinase [Cupriavidus sp. USMAHM13]AOZ10130.1 two-component sensor histidine kinase [Cupriavidus malaysiensis]